MRISSNPGVEFLAKSAVFGNYFSATSLLPILPGITYTKCTNAKAILVWQRRDTKFR